jgi:hypothetical protein
MVMLFAITRWLEGDSSVKDGSASLTAEARQFQTDALLAPVHLRSVIGSGTERLPGQAVQPTYGATVRRKLPAAAA